MTSGQVLGNALTGIEILVRDSGVYEDATVRRE
jgi:hypothetical protein